MKTNIFLLGLLAPLLASFPARCADIYWANTNGGHWSVASNWQSNSVPTSIDTVIINNESSVIVDTVASVDTLQLKTGSLTISPGSTLRVYGSSSDSSIVTAPLINYGTVEWKGSTIFVDNTGSGVSNTNGYIFNKAGAQWNIQCDQDISSLYGGTPYFQNIGTISKSGSSGTSSYNIILYNSGTVQAQSGIISFNNVSSFSGTTSNSLGAGIEFSGIVPITGPLTNLISHDFTIHGLSNLVGTVSLTNCTIDQAEQIVSPINWADGTITSSGSLTVATNVVLNMTGVSAIVGTLNNFGVVNTAGGDNYSGVFNNRGVWNISGGGNIYSPLTNSGTVNWQSGDILANTLYGNPEIWNKAGAVWNIHCDQDMVNNYTTSVFNNAGTLAKSGTSGTNTFGLILTNLSTGLLDIRQGVISLNSSSSLAGSMKFQINATNDFGSIYVSGVAAFGNVTNNVILNANYHPHPGDSFALITYDSLAGSNFKFRSLNLPPAITWMTNYSNTVFTVSVVTVNETNLAPTLPVITPRNIYASTALTVTNTATGTSPNAMVTYSLVNPVTGMAISSTGIFTWTPTAIQAPSTNKVSTIATSTDSLDAIKPVLTSTNVFTITVYSRPALSSPTILGNGTFSFSFNTLSNYPYFVEYSTNLAAWNSVTNFIGNGLTATFLGTNNVRQSAKGFYRVRATP